MVIPQEGFPGIPRIQTPPEAGWMEKVAAGIANTAGGLGNFALSPEGIATMAAPEVLGARLAKPLLGLGYSALMAKGAGQMTGQATVTGDVQDWTEAALAGGMAAGLGIAGTRGATSLLPRGRLAAIAAVQAERAKAVEERTPDATQERQQPESIPGERAGDDALRPPAEAGAGRGIRPAAESQAPVEAGRAGVLLERAQVLLDRHKAEHPEVPVEVKEAPPTPEPSGVELEGTAAEPAPAPGEGDPFAGQVAYADHAAGKVVVFKDRLAESMRRLESKGPEAQEAWFNQVMAHEQNHLATSAADAEAYTRTLSAPELALETRIYTGKWGRKAELTDRLLGWEAIRRRMTRLEGMTTDEVLGAARSERWKLQGLEVLNDTIRNIRETLGTKASKEGLAILDKVQANLGTAIAAVKGQAQPGAQMAAEEEAKPEVAKLSTSPSLNHLGDPIGTSYHATPEDWAKWQDLDAQTRKIMASGDYDAFMPIGKQREALKNKYGGMPPAPPKEMPGAQMPAFDKEFIEERIKKLRTLMGVEVKWGKTASLQDAAEHKQVLKDYQDEIDELTTKLGGGGEEQAFPGAKMPQQEFDLRRPRKSEQIERGVNIEIPEQARRLKITPSDIDWSQQGKQGSYRPISDAEANNAKAVGEIMTQDARIEGAKLPVSSSRRLGVWVNRATGETWLLSTYRASGEDRVVSPRKAGAERPTVPIDADFLKTWKPLYSVLRDSPVKHFYQRFETLDEYQARFGEEAGQRSQESVGKMAAATPFGTKRRAVHGSSEYEYRGGEKQGLPEVPTEVQGGVPASADLKAFHDFFEGEIPETKTDFDRAIGNAGSKATRQMANAVYQAALAEEKANPEASWNENIEGALTKLYEDLKNSDTRSGFIEAATQRYSPDVGKTVQERRLAAAGQAARGEAPSPTARELTTPGRGPIPTGTPLARYPQKFPPEPARQTLSPEAQRFVARQAEAQEGTLARGFDVPKIARPTGPPTGAPPLGPGWPLRVGPAKGRYYATGQPSGSKAYYEPTEPRLPTGTMPEGYKESRATLKLEGEKPGAMMPSAREAKDLVDRSGEAFSLIVSRRGLVSDTARALDSADNQKGNLSQQIENRIRAPSVQKPTGLGRLRLPWQRGNKEVLHAANVLVEAGFNRTEAPGFLAKIDAGRVKAQDLLKTGTIRQKQVARGWLRDLDTSEKEVRYAIAHWDDPALQETSYRARQAMDDIIRKEHDAGIVVTKLPSYLGHRFVDIWRSFDTIFNPSVIGRMYREPRTFKTHYDALEAGPFMRVTHDIASLASHRYRQGLGAILRDQWKEALLDMKLPDGTPMAVKAKQASGGGLIPGDPRYKLVGNTGLAVLKDYHSGLNNLFAENVIENYAPTRNLLYATQLIKHTLLVGDFFHLGRMTYYGTSIIGLQTYELGQKGVSVLDWAERDIPEAVRKGLVRPADADWAKELVPYGDGKITRRALVEKFYGEMGANLGRVQDALYKDLVTNLTPMAGPVRRGLQAALDPSVGRYNRFLFDKFTRGLMSESVVHEYERQHAILSKRGTDFNPDALMRDIAKDVNNFYGNIGRQGILKAKWQQDLARMLFLAPQWVEGLLKKEVVSTARLTGLSKVTGQREGLTGLGTTGMAIGKGLLFLAGLTQAINLITRKQPTWQNEEEGHKMDAWIPGFGADSHGFWLSPLAIFNEVTHDLWRLYNTKPTFADAVSQIAGNKEQPITRAAMILGTGVTPTGERTTTTGGRLQAAAGAAVPVPITFGRYAQAAGHAALPGMVSAPPAGSMMRQAFGTAGIKVEPAASDAGNVGELARKFMAKEGLTKTTGWQQVQTDAASYSKLRTALRNDDEGKARRILDELRKTHPSDTAIIKAMQSYSRRPFTGSQQTERQFVASLNEKQIEEYSKALDERMGLLEKFYQWYVRLE